MPSTNISAESPLALFSRAEAESVAATIFEHLKADEASVEVLSHSGTRAGFAKNEVRTVEGSGSVSVTLELSLKGKSASGDTQNLTPAGLAALVAEVEGLARDHLKKEDPEATLLAPPASFQDPPIFFETTRSASVPVAEGDMIRSAADLADAAGQIGAGDMSTSAMSLYVQNTNGFKGYTRSTYGEFSMTSRTQSGTGSGWGWGGTEDFAHVNALEIAKRAIDLAKRSENPVAVEPGRYTVILEPEAVVDFINAINGPATDWIGARRADSGYGVFAKRGGGNKIGETMTDERVQLLYDPLDPLMPISPMHLSGWMYARTYWIQNGVLRNLGYNASYARQMKHAIVLNPMITRLEVTTPPQSLEEMIATTKRGIWVHHLVGTTVVDQNTLLLTGLTRDGTFLIENGQITKPIKNMRFSESPFFILNKIDAAGEPVRSSSGTVSPRLKVHDFEFTSLSDAI